MKSKTIHKFKPMLQFFFLSSQQNIWKQKNYTQSLVCCGVLDLEWCLFD